MTHPPLQDPPKAALWMIGAILSFSAMAIGGRQVSHLHDTFEGTSKNCSDPALAV